MPAYPMYNPETGQFLGMSMYPYAAPFFPQPMYPSAMPPFGNNYRGSNYRGRFPRRGRGRGRANHYSYDDRNDDSYDHKRRRDYRKR